MGFWGVAGMSFVIVSPDTNTSQMPRLLLASATAALSLSALLPTASAQEADRGDIDHAILLSVSEPVTFDGSAYTVDRHGEATEARRQEQARVAAAKPAVPEFGTEGAQTPELSRAIQVATALRLRGETVAAGEAYAQVLSLSRKPIHAFFYSEVARANGDDVLADYLAASYEKARAAGGELPKTSPVGERDIRIAGLVTDARTGAKLVGVEVRVLDPLAYREYVAETDENGLFVVDGVSRRADLKIVSAKAGYELGDDALYVDPAHTAHAPMMGTRVYLAPTGGSVTVN